MSRNKREKGYWQKCKETFKTGERAKERAGELRMHDHVAHVLMDKQEDAVYQNSGQYLVTYSVAKWYLEDLARANIKL